MAERNWKAEAEEAIRFVEEEAEAWETRMAGWSEAQACIGMAQLQAIEGLDRRLGKLESDLKAVQDQLGLLRRSR